MYMIMLANWLAERKTFKSVFVDGTEKMEPNHITRKTEREK